MKKSFILLSVFFIVLNIADVLLTRFALSRGLSEGNPALSSNMDLLIPIKIIGISMIILLAVYLERKHQIKSPLIYTNIMYVFVVGWNVLQIINSGVI